MPEANRKPVFHRYDALNWDFIKLLAEIAFYADEKYGSAEQYVDSRLDKDKAPINHIVEHIRQYVTGEPHDKFVDPIYHLAAIAYNAMMEAAYHRKFGHTVSRLDLKVSPELIKVPAKWDGRTVFAPGTVIEVTDDFFKP